MENAVITLSTRQSAGRSPPGPPAFPACDVMDTWIAVRTTSDLPTPLTVSARLYVTASERVAVLLQKERGSLCEAMGTRAVLLLAAGAAAALASTTVMYRCEQPMGEECKAAFIVCQRLDAANCSAAGGHVVANGGVCSVCDICVTAVGWGQPCNYTTDVGGPVTSLCSAPLVCSHRFNGTCLRPQECL